jgi:antagonist of KipI
MSLRVLNPGLLTTIQDLGRHGYQQYGVVVGGAMDPLALRIANLLVGNEEGEAGLEISFSGPRLRFERDTLIAITGADLSPEIDGLQVPAWRPVWVKNGAELKFGAITHGCRACLAAAGGFDVPQVMQSRSTYLRAQIGGFKGRPLAAGDVLPLRPMSPRAHRRFDSLSLKQPGRNFAASFWSVSVGINTPSNPSIRVTPGSQFDWFTETSRQSLMNDEFTVTPQSDRMGYRLAGPPFQFAISRELLSEAVTIGTVQVVPEGQMILLMADRPTTGGYAKIAQVASVDIPLLAQLKPGDKLRFQMITVDDAQTLYRARESMVQKLRRGIELTMD